LKSNLELILASTSPYRAALLSRLRLPFVQAGSEVDEDSFKSKILDPLELTKTLAFEKASSVFRGNPSSIIIGGDQVSTFNGEILGKPGDRDKAIAQLIKLQGATHQLMTSTCILSEKEKVLWTEVTTLKMRPLTEEQCIRYVQKDNPIDCAGSYKIEEHGITLFESIEGDDQSAIVGLPLIRLTQELTRMGFQVP